MILPLLVAGLLLTPSGTVYDGRGEPQGYVKASRPGHVDLYDRHSRRLGYGRLAPDGRVDFYDVNSRRLFEIRPERPPVKRSR